MGRSLEFLLIEVEEILEIKTLVGKISIEVCQRLIALTLGDTYEDRFVEVQLSVLHPSL